MVTRVTAVPAEVAAKAVVPVLFEDRFTVTPPAPATATLLNPSCRVTVKAAVALDEADVLNGLEVNTSLMPTPLATTLNELLVAAVSTGLELAPN